MRSESRWATATKGSDRERRFLKPASQSQGDSYAKLQSPPASILATPGVSGGAPQRGGAFYIARINKFSLGVQVRCFSIRTWPAQFVACGGEVAAFSKEEDGALVT